MISDKTHLLYSDTYVVETINHLTRGQNISHAKASQQTMSTITYYKWHDTCMQLTFKHDWPQLCILPLVWLIVDICMVVFVLPVLCFRVIEIIKTYLSPSHSHTGLTQHLSLMDMPRKYTEYHLLIKWTASLRQFSSQRRP